MTEFVYGLPDGIASQFGKFAVLTMEPPWSFVRDRLGGNPESVTLLEGLQIEYLDKLVGTLPEVDAIVGVGGGVACDAAKYFAWRRGCSLFLIPTIVSVNAYATRRAATIRDGVISYLPKSRTLLDPVKVIIDLEAIKRAPKHLNTAGVGDLYSCSTALFDWQLARERLGESYDEVISHDSEKILKRLLENAEDIRNVTDKGIRTIAELHIETNRLITKAGKSRPEEGSEHIFFYTLEELTHRLFVHGEVIGTGIFVIRHLQTGDEDRAGSDMDEMGLMFRPRDYGLSHDEFVQTVLQMRNHSERTNRFFSIVNTIEIERNTAEVLWQKLLK